ncbi:MAG: class III extradiol ring-cleavage dioxygenase [Burkholderiales bacterium]|nr:class III extradiol ring-cleavage dioxygenase [Burkholderiales bacterium]
MTDSLLPVLFVSHGSPMFALDPGQTGPALQRMGARLRERGDLRAVLVLSPHWMSRGIEVMTHPRPATWHDFGGFPAPLYRLQYPAPGAPELAQQVLELLQAAGLPAQADPERPFDHGAWVPLRFLLPAADLPVLQLSLPAHAGPRELYALGQALAGLREQGVLILATGSMTHNLREFMSGRPEQDAPAAPYVQEFARWVEATLLAQDRERLFDYRRQAPHAVRAHPTDEHYLPLYFALGAAGWGQPGAAEPEYLNREVMYSYLAMDAIAFD